MKFEKKEIVEFIEYVGFIKNDEFFKFEYIVMIPFWGTMIDLKYNLKLKNTKTTFKLYRDKSYIGSFTKVSELIEYFNDINFFPIDLIHNIRAYKLHKIKNILE